VIEVKTTDTYRINLDTVANYRRALGANGELSLDHSSILIVLGRQDTGDLEAQIRGSRHAWDVRLVSTDSLTRLLSLKEKLNDPKTLAQIGQILKPNEYTRIDQLVNLVFTTAKDVELDDEGEHVVDDSDEPEPPSEPLSGKKFTPVSFHQECIDVIQEWLGITLIKQSKSAYKASERSLGVNVAVSKLHRTAGTRRYWFAFHPHQQAFLNHFEEAYVGFGCGSPENLFLIPFETFLQYRDTFNTTDTEEKMYWHVVIYERNGTFDLYLPSQSERVSLESYRVQSAAEQS